MAEQKETKPEGNLDDAVELSDQDLEQVAGGVKFKAELYVEKMVLKLVDS